VSAVCGSVSSPASGRRVRVCACVCVEKRAAASPHCRQSRFQCAHRQGPGHKIGPLAYWLPQNEPFCAAHGWAAHPPISPPYLARARAGKVKGEVVEAACVIELPFLNGRAKITGTPLFVLVEKEGA